MLGHSTAGRERNQLAWCMDMGLVDLILGTFLTAWSRWRRKPLLLNKLKKYYYKKNFSLIKPLEHFKIFTFYIIEKKFFDIKNWRNLR